MRLHIHRLCKAGQAISIHAPTRGATTSLSGTPALPGISIHAPTRGATRQTIPIESRSKYFNSRTYTRCDRMEAIQHLRCCPFQFTHLHEVRQHLFHICIIHPKFQFTHLHEVRHVTVRGNNSFARFQFTHLHEVRLVKINFNQFRLFVYFNSRTYTRCDVIQRFGAFASRISIHAPTRGATLLRITVN